MHDLVVGSLVVAGVATLLGVASVAVASYPVVALAVGAVAVANLLLEVAAPTLERKGFPVAAVVGVVVAIPLPAGGGYIVAVAMRCYPNHLDIAVWLVPPFAVAPASASSPLPGTVLPMTVVVVAAVL